MSLHLLPEQESRSQDEQAVASPPTDPDSATEIPQDPEKQSTTSAGDNVPDVQAVSEQAQDQPEQNVQQVVEKQEEQNEQTEEEKAPNAGADTVSMEEGASAANVEEKEATDVQELRQDVEAKESGHAMESIPEEEGEQTAEKGRPADNTSELDV